ncbi:MAG TPA: hypothetical protein PK431_02005 [Chitinophagales bacterium]|nr:hypothetical protein [Chitinophagales bacterium]
MIHSKSFSQDTTKIYSDTLTTSTDRLIIAVDSSMPISIDSLKSLKRIERSQKAKKAFKFLSYFNYSDRGYGKQFSGVEKYEKYKGKKIGCVQIEIFKPFGGVQDNMTQIVTKGQKFGNKIHFRSREWYVKGDVLFKEGDEINPTLFADTEKLLWDRKKFKDVRILISEDSTTNEVDVLVYLQDKLSYSVAAGYSGNRVSIFASTYNFFGLPNSLSLFAGVNFNKYNIWAAGGTYRYQNIQSSQINFTTKFIIERLNQNVQLSVNRNFFSIKSKWAFNALYNYKNITLSLNGNPRDPSSFVKAKSHYYSLWLATSIPVNKLMPCKDDKLKFVIATKLNYQNYKTRPFIIDRNFNETFIKQQNYKFGFGIARWDFYLEHNAFYVDIAEYFPRGISASVWTGPQFDEIYGHRTSLDLTINYGIYFKKFGYLYPQASYSTYIRDKKGEQMNSKFNLDYVSKKVAFAKHMFFRQVLKGGLNLGFFVPEERYFNINEINGGIRGFYSPTLKGSKSLTCSAEIDLFLDRTVILSKGMVYAFCDMGWISENGKQLITQSNYQYGLGAGLRFRSVDLGFPYLDFQFSVYPRGKNFGAQIFQFKLYEGNINAIYQNNMFIENPSVLNQE